jgi:ABC-type transporter Mla MlaB component
LAGEHFANGKTQAAQNLLEQAIGERGGQEGRIPTWLALFDLYRASDQMDRFEALAMDFSIRFGRSPPPWVSLPQQAALAEREHDGSGAQVASAMGWSAPPKLSQSDLFALETAVQTAIKAPHQLMVNLQAFVGSSEDQWRLLKAALQYLATMPVHCSVLGAADLEQSFAPDSAEATLAKLALLRCQNRAQQFEDLAIDYSMQFEISPPDWTRPECRFEIASAMAQPIELAPELTSMAPELYGVLDAARAVKQLASLTASDGLVIRCDRLVRCDPVAVMAISRFAQAAKEQGQNIELQGVHRVLAAFFAMQNLYDSAKVTIRRD